MPGSEWHWFATAEHAKRLLHDMFGPSWCHGLSQEDIDKQLAGTCEAITNAVGLEIDALRSTLRQLAALSEKLSRCSYYAPELMREISQTIEQARYFAALPGEPPSVQEQRDGPTRA